jgi:hypothetical protein
MVESERSEPDREEAVAPKANQAKSRTSSLSI